MSETAPAPKRIPLDPESAANVRLRALDLALTHARDTPFGPPATAAQIAESAAVFEAFILGDPA